MTSRAPFETRLAASFSPEQWGESGAVVAFSAGPDSTALLAALAELRDRFAGCLCQNCLLAFANHPADELSNDAASIANEKIN